MKFIAPVLLSAAAVMSLCGATAAKANVVINISQVGPDVALNSTGTFDETLATAFVAHPTSGSFNQGVAPVIAYVGFGTQGNVNVYNLIGPASFGSGSGLLTTSDAGTGVGLNGSGGVFFIASDYVNNSLFSSSATISNATLSSLGATPGAYNYLVGKNALTVNIGKNLRGAVPEPATWVMMLVGFGAIGMATRRKRTPALARA